MSANSERAEDEMSGQHPIWLFWVGILALAALWWVNRQIAKRFHRRFNVGLAAAAIAIAVLTVLAVFLAQDQSGDNDALVLRWEHREQVAPRSLSPRPRGRG